MAKENGNGKTDDIPIYENLTAPRKKLAQEIYRLYLRRYTVDQTIEILSETGAKVSEKTVRRYIEMIRRRTKSKYENFELDELIEEEKGRFREIISTLWNDHTLTKQGSNARVGAINAIINAEVRLAELEGLTMNKLKIEADVRSKVTGYLDLDVGEETLEQLDGIIERIIVSGTEDAGEGVDTAED